MDLPLGQWPKPTVEDKMEYLVGAMKSLHSYGIVGAHDAGVVPEDIELYDEYVFRFSIAGEIITSISNDLLVDWPIWAS
jgi:hypothetical protein